MTSNARRTSNRIVTLVVRLWPDGSNDGASNGFRCEATHVQTGEVVYLRDVSQLIQYIGRLSANASEPLILS